MLLDHLTARAHADHHADWTAFATAVWRRVRRPQRPRRPVRLA